MVGILLILHDPLASAFMTAVSRMFEGEPERIEAMDVLVDQDLDDIKKKASEAIARVNNGSGVLIFTDVLGGTPSNCGHDLVVPGQVEVLTGLSLPMLLRAINYRHEKLETVIEKSLSGGKSGALRMGIDS